LVAGPPTQWSRLLTSAIYGLAIGVVEEGVLYLSAALLAARRRSWAKGLMLGVGMGAPSRFSPG